MNYSLEKLKLSLKIQIQILLIQLRILILRQKLTIPNLPGPKAIVVHYEAGNLGFDGVNRYHEMIWGFKSSLGFYCGYHDYMELDSKIYKARADNEEAAHCVEPGRPHYWNRNALSICIMGDNTKFTEEMKAELKGYLDRKRIKYGIPYSDVYAHQDIKSTLCPGSLIYKWLQEYKNPIRS